MVCFNIVIFFPLQPIQDKEIIAEDEQTFLAKQQVGFFWHSVLRLLECVILYFSKNY